MKKILILPLLITILSAQTIKPKRIKARDSYRGGHHRNRNNPIVSTVEASSEISVQISSVISLEVSTEATSGQPHRGSRNYSKIEFLNNNRFKITEDISNGGGEHLLTLMSMMHLKKNSTTLTKIQSNFENLLALENEAFLLELRDIVKT